MIQIRPLPHEYLDSLEEVADFKLMASKTSLDKVEERVFSGRLDDNLVMIFDIGSNEAALFATLRYFFGGATTDELLDELGSAAEGYASLFRLLSKPEGEPVEISWLNRSRTAAALPHTNLQQTPEVSIAMILAVLSGREDELEFLTGLQREHIVSSDYPAEPKYFLEYVQWLQLLFANRDEEAKALVPDLLRRIPDDKTPDGRYFAANCRMFYSIPFGDEETTTKHIAEQIRAHRILYDSDRNKMRLNVLGFFSLYAMAALCAAHKRKMPIDISSKYLPENVVRAAVKRNS